MQTIIEGTRRYVALTLQALGLCAFTTVLALLVIGLATGLNMVL